MTSYYHTLKSGSGRLRSLLCSWRAVQRAVQLGVQHRLAGAVVAVLRPVGAVQAGIVRIGGHLAARRGQLEPKGNSRHDFLPEKPKDSKESRSGSSRRKLIKYALISSD